MLLSHCTHDSQYKDPAFWFEHLTERQAADRQGAKQTPLLLSSELAGGSAYLGKTA